jgi:uncharacterized membrane protein YqjE
MPGNSKAAHGNGAGHGIAGSISNLAEGLSNLVAQHLQLARLEVTADAKAIGLELAKMVIYLPFVLVGYAVLCVAAAVALHRWVSLDVALLVVGLANVCGGALGLYLAANKLKTKKVLEGSLDELGSSAALFASSAPVPRRLEAPRGQ